MVNLPDDPIISCIERTGYPWWMLEPQLDDDLFAIYDPE